ncbi:MAG: alpha/beta hydrolase [Bacteroidota bacterium]
MNQTTYTWIFILLIALPLSARSQTRYIDDLFSEIHISTLTYAEKEGEVLQLDVYAPQHDTLQKRPVLFWVHGGGFYTGQRDSEPEVKWMKAFAKKGYVAIAISYRLLRKGTKEGFGCDCPREAKIRAFKEAAADLMDAILYIQKQAATYQIDPNQILIGGSSAGAETVLSAAYMRNIFFQDQPQYLDLKFAGMISLAGAMVDVRHLTKENAIPTIMFHGTDDDLVPYATAPHHYCPPEKTGYLWLDGSQTIAQKLESLDTSYFLYTFHGAKHEIAFIPFDYQASIFTFLQEVVIEKAYQTLLLEKK